jgi:hypothetical protein
VDLLELEVVIADYQRLSQEICSFKVQTLPLQDQPKEGTHASVTKYVAAQPFVK